MLSPLLQMAKKTVETVSMMPFQALYVIPKATADAIIKAGKKTCKIF